jgi:hypothetical protein
MSITFGDSGRRQMQAEPTTGLFASGGGQVSATAKQEVDLTYATENKPCHHPPSPRLRRIKDGRANQVEIAILAILNHVEIFKTLKVFLDSQLVCI